MPATNDGPNPSETHDTRLPAIVGGSPAEQASDFQTLLLVVERAPDGFVVTGSDGRNLTVHGLSRQSLYVKLRRFGVGDAMHEAEN